MCVQHCTKVEGAAALCRDHICAEWIQAEATSTKSFTPITGNLLLLLQSEPWHLTLRQVVG